MICVAYIAEGDLTGTYYIPKNEWKKTRCPDCHSKLIYEFYNPDFKINSKLDYIHTTDGFDMISDKTLNVLMGLRIPGIRFKKLNKSPGWYHLMADIVLAVDTSYSVVRYIDLCKTCNHYKSVLGPHPCHLKSVNTPILNGIFYSDIKFASAYEKAPLLILGVHTKTAIQAAKLRGFDFEAIHAPAG